MLRISKLTDYGTVILSELASAGDLVSATRLAESCKLGLPTVNKILKMLAKNGLVNSVRGAAGGYRLARPAEQISAGDILDALEGPVTLTECSGASSHCQLEGLCAVESAWQRINRAIRQALDDVTLSDLRHPERIAVDRSLRAASIDTPLRHMPQQTTE